MIGFLVCQLSVVGLARAFPGVFLFLICRFDPWKRKTISRGGNL
jgi:hypothetical protein